MINQNGGGFLSGIPVVTKNLIIINVLMWVASLVLPRVGIDLTSWLGLHFPGAKYVCGLHVRPRAGTSLGAQTIPDLLYGDGYRRGAGPRADMDVRPA